VNRFWNKVARSDGCWLWTGSTDRSGYGHFRLNGQNVTAHRAAIELSGQRVPPGHVVAHTCENRACVRPDHLTLTTKVAVVLANGPRALLSEEEEREAVRLYVNRGKSTGDIGPILGCSPALVAKILGKRGIEIRTRRVPLVRISAHGYAVFDRRYVHRIVAEAWYGPIPPDHHVHHRDGDKLNNHPDNLEILHGSDHNSMHGVELFGVWDDQMDAFLTECLQRKIPERCVAGVLGLSKNSVNNRRNRLLQLGRATKARPGRRWKDRDYDADARALWDEYTKKVDVMLAEVAADSDEDSVTP